MTKLFALCHDDIWTGTEAQPGVSESLTVATGEMLDADERDYNPDTNTWGEPYTVQRERTVGGWQHIGRRGQWGAYVLESTAARLQAINSAAPAAKWLALAVLDDDDEIRQTTLNAKITSAARTKLNTALAARSLPLIPTGWTNKRMLRAVFAAFEGEYDKDGVLERVL